MLWNSVGVRASACSRLCYAAERLRILWDALGLWEPAGGDIGSAARILYSACGALQMRTGVAGTWELGARSWDVGAGCVVGGGEGPRSRVGFWSLDSHLEIAEEAPQTNKHSLQVATFSHFFPLWLAGLTDLTFQFQNQRVRCGR